MEIEQAMKIAEELKKYAEIEGCELGEYCQVLCGLVGSFGIMSKIFRKFVEAELLVQLQNFKDNSEIVETETMMTHKSKELEWK